MSLLRYMQRETPPDRWRWQCPRTGHRVEAMDRATWLAEIEKFNRDNGFELEEGWQALAEHYFCMTLPPGFCQYGDGSTPQTFLNTRTTAATIVAGTEVFMAFVLSGGKLVEPSVAEERAKTCAACFAAVYVPGCGGCAGLVNTVMDVVGKGTTSADDQLRTKSCAWCKCSALANCWVPTETSAKGVTDEMLSVDIPWCWKIREIRELRKVN